MSIPPAADERQRHQQRGDVLARHAAAHPRSHRPGEPAPRPDAERRVPVLAEIGDVRAQALERLDEIADGPLVHARRAGDPILGRPRTRGPR